MGAMHSHYILISLVRHTVAREREGVRNTSGFTQKRQARGGAHLGLHCDRAPGGDITARGVGVTLAWVGRSWLVGRSDRRWVVSWVSGSVGRSVSWSDGKSKLSHVRSHQSICRFERSSGRWLRPSAVGLARAQHLGPHLGLHSSRAGPRWGTPRASPQPAGAPGGANTVKPEVFLTPSRARASV